MNGKKGCEHSWYKKDGWNHWRCEKCGEIKTMEQDREERKQRMIELNKKFREFGYEGNPIVI